MKIFKLLAYKNGFVVCAALGSALIGCTTYVQQPPSRVEYHPAPPPPREIYVPPPAAYVPPPAVQVSVEFEIREESDFYEPLTPYGRWEVIGRHGRCWIPARVESNWRPYCNGNWERTDAGWYWASEEPWAWATYHYGRWDLSAEFGWYWVPQTQWAPAWVSWHSGGGYVGWAPLQPSVRVSAGGSISINVALIAPRAFIFVEPRRFLQPVRPTSVVVNNTTIINQTVNITNIKVVNNTVINEGPRTQVIEEASGQQVRAVPVRELRRKHEAEVVTRHRTASTGREKNEKNVQSQSGAAPKTGGLDPNAQLESQRRVKETEALAQEQLQRNANETKKAAQLESQRQANEAGEKAQKEARSEVQESERIAEQQAQQRGKEKKAQLAAQAAANELENKGRLESQRHAKEKEAQAQAQEQLQRNANETKKASQLESQRQTREVRGKAQQETQTTSGEAAKANRPVPTQRGNESEKVQGRSAERVKGAQTESKGTNVVKKVSKKKGKEKASSPEVPEQPATTP
jgi:hypothetical protein